LSFDSRCTFGSEKCRSGTITPTLTDLGICYTFNNDPNNQLVSDASGTTNRSLMAFQYIMKVMFGSNIIDIVSLLLDLLHGARLQVRKRIKTMSVTTKNQ